MASRQASTTISISAGGALLLLLAGCGGGGSGAAPQPAAPNPAATPPQRGSLQFAAAAYSVAESASTLTIGIAREGGTDGAVSVALGISGGSATAGVDHGAIAATLSFADGEGGTKTLSIAIIDDSIDEPDETLLLSIANPAGGATLGARTSTSATILDDDSPPTYSIGGIVSGLQGTGLVLRNNGGNDLPIAADGAFVFPVELNPAAPFDVTIATQPSSPEQECAVTQGSGIVSADVTSVRIDCLTLGPLQTVVYMRQVSGQYDLYAVRENGLRNTALAPSADDEIFAGVAPDGRILFTRNDVLYSIRADGTGLATVDDSGHFPTPQGANTDGVLANASGRIVVARHVPHAVSDHQDLDATFADGSGSVKLAATEDDEEFVGVSPSGRVVFRRLPAGGGNVDLYSIRPDGTGMATLAASPNYEEFQGVTAAGRIVFRRDAGVGQQDIYSVNEDGTGLGPVAATAQDERFAALTSDGKVIFTRSNDLFIVNADGTGERLLAGGTRIETFQGFSSTGVVVFSRRAIGSQDWNLYAVNPDGTGEVALATTADFETFAGITADGRLVYRAAPIVAGNTGFADIYCVDLDGTDRVRLTDTPNDEEEAQFLTPEGTVVFQRITSGQADVMAVDADDSGSVIPLAATAARETGHAVTANGRLLFLRDQGGDVELWSIGVDGSDPQALGSNAGDGIFVAIF